MFLGISTFIWILFIVLLIIAFAFLFYRQVIYANLVVVTLLFPVSFVVATSALFLPVIYHGAAEVALKDSQFGQQLQTMDSTLTAAGKVPSNVLNEIQKIFNQNNAQQSEYKSELYPQFVTFVAEILRWLVFIFSFIVMLLVAYSRYAFSSVFQIDKLEKRVHELEKKQEKI